MVSFPAAAQGTLNSYQTVDIKAPIWTVWDAVKDFDGLHTWHPMFSDDELKSGANDEIGAVRTLTVKDGPSFDEELLSFDPVDRKFSYRVKERHLADFHYLSTFQLVEGRRGHTTICGVAPTGTIPTAR